MWTPEALVVVGVAIVSFTFGTIWLCRLTHPQDDAALWRFRDR